MALNCYDFDAGQPRHFPAGSYYQQVATITGEMELDVMSLLRRCWLVFKHKKLSDWNEDDMEFAHWLTEKPPINDDNLNRIVRHRWQLQAV